MKAKNNSKRILHLHLKYKWYDQIASGKKPDEMRLATDKWSKRLVGQCYDEVCLYRGYPKKCNYEGNRMFRKFGGVTKKTVKHEEFGSEPVEVFVIDVSQEVNRG